METSWPTKVPQPHAYVRRGIGEDLRMMTRFDVRANYTGSYHEEATPGEAS